MFTIAVIGANGYVGKAICSSLYDTKNFLAVFPVIRSSYEFYKERSYDIIINCAMPSKRFWAQEHPDEDFIETVKKTADLVYGWNYKKFIQISSLSARCERDIIYGKHKAMAEKLCESKNNLIIRLTAMYSPDISREALFDILKGNKVYASAESKYAFTSLDFVGNWIADNLDRSGSIELGARNTITLNEIANYLNKEISFGDKFDVQEIANPESDFPDARDVLKFMNKIQNSEVLR